MGVKDPQTIVFRNDIHNSCIRLLCDGHGHHWDGLFSTHDRSSKGKVGLEISQKITLVFIIKEVQIISKKVSIDRGVINDKL